MMTAISLHQPPRMGAVIREQFRATAHTLYIPALGAAGITAIVTALAFADFFSGRGGVEFAPELSLVPALAGVLMAIIIWQRQKSFGSGYFWTLPVDRSKHAFAKVFAGWMILMIGAGLFLAWLLVLALITKGNITGDEMIKLLPGNIKPGDLIRALDPAVLTTVRWIPKPAFWLMPFTAATGTYVITTAVALGLKHPVRWIIAVVAAAFLITAIGQGIASDAFFERISPITRGVMYGRYGLDALLSGRNESLKTVVALTNGKTTSAWYAIPTVSDWIGGTLLWIGCGVIALMAALYRHREQR